MKSRMNLIESSIANRLVFSFFVYSFLHQSSDIASVSRFKQKDMKILAVSAAPLLLSFELTNCLPLPA